MDHSTQDDDHTPDRAFTAKSHYGMGGESTYAGARSFMRRRYSRDLTGVDVAVSGVPLDLARDEVADDDAARVSVDHDQVEHLASC